MPESEFPNLLISFGQKAKARRKGLGLNQEELATKAGLHRTYIADIERGARNLSMMNIAKIAKALGVNISELCQGIDNSQKDESLPRPENLSH